MERKMDKHKPVTVSSPEDGYRGTRGKPRRPRWCDINARPA